MTTRGKVVRKLGKFPEYLTISDFRLDRKGFLSTYSFATSDANHRMDMLYRRDAVVMLPMDPVRREVYTIVIPRHLRHFAGDDVGAGKAPHFAPGMVALTHQGNTLEDVQVQVPFTSILTLEFPAGIIDDGETPLEAARRELREETGLHAPADGFEEIATYFPSVGGSTERLVAYFVCVSRSMLHVPTGDGGERLEVRRMSFEDAWEAMDGGEISSASGHILLRELRIRYGAAPRTVRRRKAAMRKTRTRRS